MSDNAQKAQDILQKEYDRLIDEGVSSINAKDFQGKDVFSLEEFSSWKPSALQQAKDELLKFGFLKKNILGEYSLVK